MKKIIGNICFIVAGICLLLGMFTDMESDIIGPLAGISMWTGIFLRAGDFFKWRGKKHAEGFQEASQQQAAQQNASHYCPKCGNGLAADAVFCSKCGNKIE